MILEIAIVFVISLVLGVPIAITLALATLTPILLHPELGLNIQYVIRATFAGVDNTPILAIPLFILSGAIMAKGGIARKLFDVFGYFIGNKTAGMPIAVIVTSLFYGAISGSGIATTAAVGSMTIPILISLGYDKVFIGALVAASGGLGVIIPPSIPFVMYGLVTGVSVGSMFMAGILPGILIALALISYTYLYFRIKGEDKDKIRAYNQELKSKGFVKVFREGFWALLTPVIILGGIYSGVVTPTEAANVSVFYSIIVALFIYKTIKISELMGIMRETVKSYAPLILLLGFAIAFGRVLTIMQAPQIVADYLAGNFGSQITLLIALNIVLLFLGMVMDVGPAMVILSPILLPVATQMGINPIHLGIIMSVNLAIGFVTPPFGVNLFVAAPLIDTPVMTLGKKAAPFVLAIIVALMLITYIPQISLILV